MDIRHPMHPEHAMVLDTEDLRSNFLIDTVFIPGQISVLIAAIATICVLAQTLLAASYTEFKDTEVFSAGVLGFLFFFSSNLVKKVGTQGGAGKPLTANI